MSEKPVNDFNVRRFSVLSEGRMVEVVTADAFDQLAKKYQQLMDMSKASMDLASLAINAEDPKEHQEIERLRGIIAALLRGAQDDGEFAYEEGSARLVVTLRPYRADWKDAVAAASSVQERSRKKVRR